jgi:hypothetical protein
MRLIAFGDSWTAGHGVEQNILYKEDPTPPLFIEKLREQNSWPRWTANKLNIPFVNISKCGWGNEYIYNSVEDSIPFIKKDDIVVIVFSYPYRYERHNQYSPFELFNKFEELLDGYNRFYFNGFYPLLNDIEENIEFPKHYINPFGTLSYILQVEEIQNKKDVWEYGSKSVWSDEKNYYEGDYHPNLEGYKIIGNYIYSELKPYINA